MHEYGVCEGVLDAVRARARGRRVAAIRVRFGVWHAVDAQSLSDAFESVAAGTEAADAAIELVTVPAQITCRACGSSADSTDLIAVCPRCASTDVELAGGDEMTLESVTYVPERPPPTQPEGDDMCLGIPARLVDGDAGHPDLAIVEVGGVPRPINLALLEERPGPGDWVLVHMGFALQAMTEAEAADALAALSAERDAEAAALPRPVTVRANAEGSDVR